MKNKLAGILTLLCLWCTLQAAVVDTVQVFSPAMKKEVQVVVIAPEKINHPVPVVYLLHGYSGNAKTWLSIKPELQAIADSDQLIFVCPDGKNSWYWDSPEDPTSQYETFITQELIPFVDQKYPTKATKTGRAITGLSMGGHGAMWLAMRNSDLFGAAGSTSGGMDIRPFPNNWEMSKQLGKASENRERWDAYTVINQVDQLKNGDLALIIDCGTNDFFLEVNRDMHHKLLKYGIGHDYYERPGGHDQRYWN